MLEVSRIYLILLHEGFGLLAILLLVVIVLTVMKKTRKTRAIRQLADQIRAQSEVRREETGSFLRDIYQLEDDELQQAIQTIDSQEKKFFQQLIDIMHREDNELIPSLDAMLAELIDTYKGLKPKQQDQPEDTGLVEQNEELRASNEKLQEELAITKETMSNMIAEFGNMFGGGSDHELAKHEVVEKLAVNESEDSAGQQAGGDFGDDSEKLATG